MSRPEPGPGSVIAFQLQLEGRPYSFAAVNVGGQWATTSRAGAPLLTWAQLDRVLDYAAHVYVASAWAELAPLSPEQRAAMTAANWGGSTLGPTVFTFRAAPP